MNFYLPPPRVRVCVKHAEEVNREGIVRTCGTMKKSQDFVGSGKSLDGILVEVSGVYHERGYI